MTARIYSKAHPGLYGISLDWETSGSNFDGDSTVSYQGIAFGAIIFNTETFEPVADLYRELHFDNKKYQWSAEAEKIHGLSREHLAQNGVPREEALADLLELIDQYIGASNKILFLGHNCDFDVDFTRQLANDFGIELKVHHVKIDTSGMAFAMIGEYKSDKVFAFFEGEERPTQHNALDDAYMALNAVKTMKALVQASLSST